MQTMWFYVTGEKLMHNGFLQIMVLITILNYSWRVLKFQKLINELFWKNTLETGPIKVIEFFKSWFYIIAPKINLNSNFFVMFMHESFVSYFLNLQFVILNCTCFIFVGIVTMFFLMSSCCHEKFNLSLTLPLLAFLHFLMMNLIRSVRP
jgi:hypothetical protein